MQQDYSKLFQMCLTAAAVLGFALWLLWTPLRKQAVIRAYRHVVGCCHLSGLKMQRCSCGPVWEFADRIHISFARLDSALPVTGSSGPVLSTVVPYPPSTAYVPDASGYDPAYAATAAGAR